MQFDTWTKALAELPIDCVAVGVQDDGELTPEAKSLDLRCREKLSRLTKRGEGLLHICLEVDDIHAEFERLKGLGVRFAEEAPWRSPHGWAAFIHPQYWRGVSIELRQFE